MDFVALGVISNLDEKYFDSLRDPLKDRMYTENFEIPIINTKKRNINTKKFGCCEKFFWGWLNFVRFFY